MGVSSIGIISSLMFSNNWILSGLVSEFILLTWSGSVFRISSSSSKTNTDFTGLLVILKSESSFKFLIGTNSNSSNPSIRSVSFKNITSSLAIFSASKRSIFPIIDRSNLSGNVCIIFPCKFSAWLIEELTLILFLFAGSITISSLLFLHISF